MRILLVGKDDPQAGLIHRALNASTAPAFEVERASNAWDAQRKATDGHYDALVLDEALTDADSDTLLRRLRAGGMRAPALLLTSVDSELLAPQLGQAGVDAYLPRTEASNAYILVRAVVGMLQRDTLNTELAAARDEGARTAEVLSALTHDLATPLGVIAGMARMLLDDDYGLNEDGRLCVEDVLLAATAAVGLLKRTRQVTGSPAPAADGSTTRSADDSTTRGADGSTTRGADGSTTPAAEGLKTRAAGGSTARGAEGSATRGGEGSPTRDAEGDALSRDQPGDRPPPVQAAGSKIVLIADDDAATRRLVSLTLASDRYSVLQASDGKEAWRMIRDHHPAVAILDWQMPIYSGLELTDVIKSDPQVWGMTVIMLTGRTTAADRQAGAQARADLYLTKPFSPQELLAAVEQALGIA